MATTFTREQFAWIVTQRASYVGPATIAEEFKRRYKDTNCTPDDIALSDRDKLDADWQGFFDAEREAFLNAPTADKRVRVGELHRMFVDARDRRAVKAAAELLEQIAKEQSDAYAPKGSKAAVAEPASTDVNNINPKMTAEQAAEAYASTLDSN